MLLNRILDMVDEHSLPMSDMVLRARVERFTVDMGMITEEFYNWLSDSEIVVEIEHSGIFDGIVHDVTATFDTPDGELMLVDVK